MSKETMTNQTSELKKCPFCPDGGKPEARNIAVRLGDPEWSVCCQTCGMMGPYTRTQEVAILSWNTHPTEQEDALRSENAELKRDKARLDALQSGLRIAKFSDGWNVWIGNQRESISDDIRQAIDAAIQSGEKANTPQ